MKERAIKQKYVHGIIISDKGRDDVAAFFFTACSC